MFLAVGDAVQIGDALLTVIDIEGDEISFRVDRRDNDCLETSTGERSSLPRK